MFILTPHTRTEQTQIVLQALDMLPRSRHIASVAHAKGEHKRVVRANIKIYTVGAWTGRCGEIVDQGSKGKIGSEWSFACVPVPSLVRHDLPMTTTFKAIEKPSEIGMYTFPQ
jgi:hypothetical protein